MNSASRMRMQTRNAALIGRSMKMLGLPCESSKDRRRFSSSNGPRMNPRIKGAPSQPSLIRKYPQTDKALARYTSKEFEFRLYRPTQQNTTIQGYRTR